MPLHGDAPASIGAGLTHTGLVRERNEDSILTDPTGALWAVADGMGGHGSGDIASDIVVERLSTAPDEGDPAIILEELITEANDRIYVRAQQSGGRTMGATVVALMIQNAIGYLAWAGDSRGYLLRRGGLRLLTRDHTVVQDLVDQGVIGSEEAHHHAQANVVTRAVGAEPEIEIDLVTIPFIAKDRVLLCSDGLTACVGDHEISAALNEAETPDDACRRLIASALEAGAPDNVSVIVVFLVEG